MDILLNLPSVFNICEFLRTVTDSLKSNEDASLKKMSKKLERKVLKLEKYIESVLSIEDVSKFDEEIVKVLPRWRKEIVYFSLSLFVDVKTRDFLFEQFRQLKTMVVPIVPNSIPVNLQEKCAKAEHFIIESAIEFVDTLQGFVSIDETFGIADISDLKEELYNATKTEDDRILDLFFYYSLITACYSQLNHKVYPQNVSTTIAERFILAANRLGYLYQILSLDIELQKNPHKLSPPKVECIELKKIPKTKYSLYKESWCVAFDKDNMGVHKYGKTIEEAYRKFWDYNYDLISSLEQSERDNRITTKMKEKLDFLRQYFVYTGRGEKQYIFSQKDLENKPTWKEIPILNKEDFQSQNSPKEPTK